MVRLQEVLRKAQQKNYSSHCGHVVFTMGELLRFVLELQLCLVLKETFVTGMDKIGRHHSKIVGLLRGVKRVGRAC